MLNDRTRYPFRCVPGAPAPGRALGVRSSGVNRKASKHATTEGTGIFSFSVSSVACFLFVLFCIVLPSISHAVAQGDHIVNVANLSSNGERDVTTSVNVTAVVPVPSKLEYLTYAPNLSNAEQVIIHPTEYRTGSDPSAPFAQMPPAVFMGSNAPLDLTQPLPFAVTAVFHQCEPVFVRLTAPDQNLDRGQLDTALITITESSTGNIEVLRLTETGPNTGIFTGYVTTAGKNCSSSVPASSYSGSLPVNEDSRIAVSFDDVFSSACSSTVAAMVDPYGIIFDSTTGKPVNGVSITLLDSSTGRPATIFGDDGVSVFPATLVTGGTTTDASGRVYSFPPGGYRYPFLIPGNYQYRVVPTPAYTGPTNVAFDQLQQLPGAPYALVTPGSRWEPFTVNPGPAIHIDIPLDPVVSILWLRKSAGKDVVAIGDFVPYELDLQNTSSMVIARTVSLVDTLPFGFRYRKGSARLNNGAAPDPSISPDGRSLTFAVGDLASQATTSISYVTEIAAGTRLGSADNTAIASSRNSTPSNVATASVQVRSDFFDSKSFIMGQVIEGECGPQEASELKGLEGARLYMEDGTFVDSDKQGMFHFEGVTPGTHVVQLDLDSLPKDYRVVACEENTRYAGSAWSQFVDVQGGSLWRADFHVVNTRKPAQRVTKEVAKPVVTIPKGNVSLELKSVLSETNKTVDYTIIMRGTMVPVKNLQLAITLPEGLAYKPGSSLRDSVRLKDPDVNGPELTYLLGDADGNWVSEIRFTAELDPGSDRPELRTSAFLTFNSPTGSDLQTPLAENILGVGTKSDTYSLPPVSIHPHFAIMSAELSGEDKKRLKKLVGTLKGLKVEHIDVVGHTDSPPIAPRSRNIYKDNFDLSLARANNVGLYIIKLLGLSQDTLTSSGMGETMPVADNTTASGRAQNRRVEVTITAQKTEESSRIKTIKDHSDPQTVETVGLPREEPVGEGEKGRTGEEAKQALNDAPEGGLASTETTTKPATEPAELVSAESGTKTQRGPMKEGILSLADGTALATRINAVRAILSSQLKPRLFLDEKEIPDERIGFTMRDNKTGKTIYSYIGVDFGEPGEHLLVFKGTDPFGNARFEQKITVRRTGEIAAIRVKSTSGNVADGKTPVRLLVEAFDAQGHIINAEYDLEVRGGTLKPLTQNSAFPNTIQMEGAERVHVDSAGNALFQSVNNSGLYRVTLAYNKATADAETYVGPNLRDWIIVGLAQGTVGYNAVTGNMESFGSSDGEAKEDLYENGRLAFYAKGRVKGEWLITAAYDSAKNSPADRERLFQTIDPNQFYTLYGDATVQQYDAASVRKIYLKIERDRFYALFGDYDTGLTVAELSKYSRRLNGLKSEMRGDHFDYNVFAANTNQAFVKDEIPGDGTSGLYHLTRKNIVLNSETVTIETRDRFRSEVIVSSTALTRFIDYSIDYDSGTIFFKAPVYSRDENFNPNFIVVNYESFETSGQAFNYGGRGAVRFLDNKLELGATHVHEGSEGGSGDLNGLDATYTIDGKTKVRVEAASTKTDMNGTAAEGSSYLAEVSRRTETMEGKAYVREQAPGFGLGQQNGGETGTRKIGGDLMYRINETESVRGETYRQYNLLTDATRDFAELQERYSTKNYEFFGGMRRAEDASDAGTFISNQFFAGTRYMLTDRLSLRVQRDQSFAGNANVDFPTRTTIGADYKLSERSTLFADEEFTNGQSLDTTTTRVGMKSSPWTGGQVSQTVEQQQSENGLRLFSTTGLKQTWQVSKQWTLDAGMDRSKTLKQSDEAPVLFNTNVPPASGPVSGTDFTAVSFGAGFKAEKWSWTARAEQRTSTDERKFGFFSGANGEPWEGLGLSAAGQLFKTEELTTGGGDTKSDLRLGLARRPRNGGIIVLDRLDFLVERQHTGALPYTNWRIVNNFVMNYKAAQKTQLSLQYGAKYVRETIGDQDYKGYTDLTGLECRYDLTKRWDIGVRNSVLHSWSVDEYKYGAGLSTGFSFVKNVWVIVGYNVAGFKDRDFSASDFTSKGPFLKLNLKFDQASVRDAVKWFSGQ